MLLTDYLLRCYLICVSYGIVDERASPEKSTYFQYVLKQY